MRIASIVLFVSMMMVSNAQIRFESGYVIQTDGISVECLIRNMDWKDNPLEFEYKLSENGEIKNGDLKNINEFGIYEGFKYVKKTVDIDRASDIVSELSVDRQPSFQQETLFLKVLIEGETNLYAYSNGNLRRYFYKTSDNDIKQLIYKRYLITNEKGEQKIAKNEQYKNQLKANFSCKSLDADRTRNLNYNSNSLIQYFKEYYQCKSSDFVQIEVQKKSEFNLTLRPRLNMTALKLLNYANKNEDVAMGSKANFGIGLEFELVFPFNKGKWAVFAEPTFHAYKADGSDERSNISGGILNYHAKYSALELGVGGRHYMLLNNDSKIYLGFSYLMDFGLGKNFYEETRTDGTSLRKIDIDGVKDNFGLSAGYKFMNKFSLEFRFETKKKLFYSSSRDIDYNSYSAILGYNFL